MIRVAALIIVTALAVQTRAHAQEGPYLFNVLTQRSVALTAQFWNPILLYVTRKSGVPLELRLARDVQEGNAIAEQGGYHFLYTNHFFTPERDRLGFIVIARPAGPGIRGQLVVPAASPVRSLRDLEGKSVAFATPDAFAAYALPMDALLKSKASVKPVFAGNQEAGLYQLKKGTVAAAAVNDQILQHYTRREGADVRVLWSSEVYNDLCIMANPRIPAEHIAAVRDALINMLSEPEGREVLETSAQVLRIETLGFVSATDRDYENYRVFYRHALLPGP